jgi:hypothetical protein
MGHPPLRCLELAFGVRRLTSSCERGVETLRKGASVVGARRADGDVAFESPGLGDIRGDTISTLKSCCRLIGGEVGS